MALGTFVANIAHVSMKSAYLKGSWKAIYQAEAGCCSGKVLLQQPNSNLHST